MRLNYTEFSFGYAFTENLIRSAAQCPSTAPVFPNLVQEARLGYDVNVELSGSLLFLQYKLPKLMVRESASEISNYHLPGIFTPFFRMSLMRRDQSDQHKLLIELEREPPNSVYYASPVLENVSQLNNAYAKTSVHMESVFFSPREIGLLPDDNKHTVVYRKGLQYAWFCSDPQEIKAFGYKDLGIIYENAKNRNQTNLSTVRVLYKPNLLEFREYTNNFGKANAFSRVFAGCFVWHVQSSAI